MTPPWVAMAPINLFDTSHGIVQDFHNVMKSSYHKTVVFAVVAYFTTHTK